MITKSVYILLLVLFVAAPFFYKGKRPFILRFYAHMASRYTCRRMYTLMMVLFLTVFHFYHLALFGNHYDLIPSSALCFLLFSHRCCERMFRFLQNKRILWASMVLALASLFVPHFLPLGIVFGTLIIGAVYYPSRMVCEKFSNLCWWHEFLKSEDKTALAELYHKWEAE